MAIPVGALSKACRNRRSSWRWAASVATRSLLRAVSTSENVPVTAMNDHSDHNVLADVPPANGPSPAAVHTTIAALSVNAVEDAPSAPYRSADHSRNPYGRIASASVASVPENSSKATNDEAAIARLRTTRGATTDRSRATLA